MKWKQKSDRKRNKKPEFSERKRKVEVSIRFDPKEMNPQMYERIRDYLRNGGDKDRIATMVPGYPNLYETYKRYGDEYHRIKNAEYGQEDLDTLNKIADEMEENLNFGLSLRRNNTKGEKSERKTEHKYQAQFDFLDKNIELIANLIYLRKPTKDIVNMMRDYMPSLTNIIYCYWAKETEKVDELIFAYQSSGEEYMQWAKEFLMEWLVKEDLSMQHVGLVREISLWSSRYAEFMDRKRWGKKIEIIEEKPQQKVITGKDLDKFLQGLNDAFEERDNDDDIKEEKRDDGEFTEFEEIK